MTQRPHGLGGFSHMTQRPHGPRQGILSASLHTCIHIYIHVCMHHKTSVLTVLSLSGGCLGYKYVQVSRDQSRESFIDKTQPP